jgi:hypothetical protein
MTRPDTPKSPDNRTSCKIEIAERVEQLVANEFVSITQATCVQHMITTDHYDVVERPAATEACRSQTVYFIEKTKCTRSAEFLFERPGVEHHRNVLAANQ